MIPFPHENYGPRHRFVAIAAAPLLLLLLVPACEKSVEDTFEPASIPSTVANADATDVIGTLQLPHGDSLGGAASLLDKIAPGASIAAAAELPGWLAKVSGVDLSGANLSRPVTLIVMSARYSQPMALLVHVRHSDELRSSAAAAGRQVVIRDGRALIGTADVVDAVTDVAFNRLDPAPKRIVVVAYPDRLLTTYNEVIEQRLADVSRAMESATGPAAGGMASLLRKYLSALTAVAHQTDRVMLTVAKSRASTGVVFRVFPQSGTSLAAFTAAQSASEHTLLDKLVADGNTAVLMSGDFKAGAAGPALQEFLADLMAAIYSSALAAGMSELAPKWIAAFDGRVALSAEIDMGYPADSAAPRVNARAANTTMSMVYLMGANDASQLKASSRRFYAMAAPDSATGEELEALGVPMKFAVETDAFSVGDVDVDHYQSSLDFERMTAEQSAAAKVQGSGEQHLYLAAFDDVAVMSMDTRGATRMKSAIKAARSNSGSLPAAIARAVAASKKRSESLLLYVNTKALVPARVARSLLFNSLTTGFGKALDNSTPTPATVLDLRISFNK